jgi:vancomycin resistance protein YoaR
MTRYPIPRGTGRVRGAQAAIPPLLFQIPTLVVVGISLFLALIFVSMIGFDVIYAGQVYPGVSVAGVELSGLRKDKAAALLAQKVTFPQTGKIVFQYGESLWDARPSELGLSLDAADSSQEAYLTGRRGDPFSRLADQVAAWHSGKNLSPVMIYDEQVAWDYLEQIAAQVDRPAVEASLKVESTNVLAVPGQIGRKIDIPETLETLQIQLHSLTDGIVSLAVEETPPDIMDAAQQAEAARQILGAPLILEIPDAQAGDPSGWTIPPEQLAGMLTIARAEANEEAGYQVSLDDEALYTYLTALAPDVDRQPGNARFIFNDDTHLLEVIQPAVIGRNLDIYTTVQEINQKIAQGEHRVKLSLVYTQPEIGDDATGEQLGITELISANTTYFRGSTTERLQNIQIAAAIFHGLLIPPGATFSMANQMGSVSLDTGYAEAWIIFGGRTIKGVGGGVCQVSTTLFRTVFFAGLPIVERHPHAYRVGYYEQDATGYDENMAGLDATVFVPMVDFKFVNDTSYWLLMETYYHPNSRSLTWKFYSTSDGRTVEWETSGPENRVDPPDPVYEENPELSQGEIKQVDWAAEGADVTVNRVVYRDGQVLFGDTFVTHYLPWADVYQYGPGTNLKKKKSQIINP